MIPTTELEIEPSVFTVWTTRYPWIGDHGRARICGPFIVLFRLARVMVADGRIFARTSLFARLTRVHTRGILMRHLQREKTCHFVAVGLCKILT